MLINNFDFAFIGGDMRQVYMINDLISKNYSVIVYGLSDPLIYDRVIYAKTLEEAILSSNVILLPIPIAKGNLIVSKSGVEIKIQDLWSCLTPMHKIYGGMFSKDFKAYLDTSNISYHDFMLEEDIIQYNSIATAEGTIASAIVNSTINLHDSSVLILGYGRCAITLALKLKSLTNNITISARKSEQLSAAHASSFSAISLYQLSHYIENYDYIFNTIPSMILSKELLDKTKESVIITDIASSPGGVDFNYAKTINRYANLYLGIPGKVAPKSSATFLNLHLLNHLGKK